MNSESNVEYLQAYGENTGLPDNYADIVTASSSIHWMPPESTLKEIVRITRRNGVFAAYNIRYPLFLDEWELYVIFKEFKLKMKDLEKESGIADHYQKYNWDDTLSLFDEQGYMKMLGKFYFHKIMEWSFSDYMGWIKTLGVVSALKSGGLSDEEIGLKRLIEKSATLFSDRKIPIMISYDSLICIIR